MRKILVGLLVILSAFVFTSCNKPDEDGGKRVTNYTMEAEYIDLSAVVGAGISSEASGVNMIHGNGTDAEKNKGWSSGYYLGFTYVANLELNFVFEAEQEAKATIVLRLGSEIGDITFDPNSLAVKLNGEAITYSNILVYGSDMADMEFKDYTITSNATLKQGENTISIVVLNNTLRSGQVGGPMVDAIKLTTNTRLTWTSHEDNPEKRGAI